MNKCPKCGREFEGKFCPDCGTQWEDEKICPSCGAKQSGGTRFCNECGYSFYPDEKVKAGKPTQRLKNFKAWIKAHLKLVIAVALAAVVIIVSACAIPACIAAQTNGTYYKIQSDGTLDKETYYILKSGKWSDEDGESGKYKKSGDKITFFVEFFGETETVEGTIKNYVLTVDGDVYVSEKHKHNYGKWTTNEEVTCTTDGKQSRVCPCGKKETKTIEKLGHTLLDGYIFDDDYHWQICSVCKQSVNSADHNDPDDCSVCGYPFFDYSLNYDRTAYIVTGIRNKSATAAYIPALYKNLPVTSIEDSAFECCFKLTSITIPDSVTSIGDSAFERCSNLTSINIPDSVTSIGDSTFESCSNLTSIIIPDPVTSIGDKAFYECSNLTSINIPDSVTSIGDKAFYECVKLTITIPNSVISIGYAAFQSCFKLTSIIIPESVTSIKEGTFFNCINLTDVTISGAVNSIGRDAFSICRKLTSITIPSSVTSIGDSAFENCRELRHIYFKGTKEQWQAIEKGLSWNNETGSYTVHCTDGEINKSDS